MKTGIYTITNTLTKHIYVGAASNVTKRLNDHLSTLRKNKHDNDYLQNSFNKYGEEAFLFELLEECEKEYMYSQENYWCNLLNSHNKSYGFNIKPTHPNNLYSCTEEIRNKIKQKAIGRKWSQEYKELFRQQKLGKKHSEDHKIKAAKGKYKPILQHDLEGNFIKEWDSAKTIEQQLNISATHISNCCTNKKSYKTAKGFKWSYKNNY